MEPQAPQIATGISPGAGDCKVTFDGLVAPKTSSQEKRSLERWLENRLGEQHGACSDLAEKLLRGVIRGSPPTGLTIRKLCAQNDATEVMRFFRALHIDDATAERIRVGTAKSQSEVPQERRTKRRHTEPLSRCT